MRSSHCNYILLEGGMVVKVWAFFKFFLINMSIIIESRQNRICEKILNLSIAS